MPQSVRSVTPNSAAVIDSSAVIKTIASTKIEAELADRVEAAAELHAPHLIDVEVANALRGLMRSGQITLVRAEGALEDLIWSPILRYPHSLLLARMWDLRDTFSAYDAAFVALSEALDLPLITGDAKLARAAEDLVEIELF